MATGATAAISTDRVDEEKKSQEKMEWFNEAKLGIFIHWGIYSVRGVAESWSFFNEYLPFDEYMDQLDEFGAENYDPAAWAELIKQSGARYTVITSKHHDGVALWDTQANNLSVPKRTPAGRDVLTPLVNELRNNDLKVGIYYSLMDWAHPDFPVENRLASKDRSKWRYNPQDTPERWNRFMDFNFIQYREIADRYNPDLWWFDGHWWFTAEEWRCNETADLIYAANSNALINSRLPGYGDYATPEQGVPLVNPGVSWEACMTINHSWGYQPTDTNYKTSYDVIRLLADCVHLGGNLLLDVGPKADGTIPEEQVEVLKGLGRWTHKHEKAVLDTHAGIDLVYYNGPSAIGKGDYLGGGGVGKDVLYLFIPHKPNGSIRLKGINNMIERAWVVGNGAYVEWRQDGSLAHPGIYYFDIPERALDQDVTVLALLLDGKIDLQKIRYNIDQN
jgi:alpha-L-fucosidase